jgi:hypothetical protein
MATSTEIGIIANNVSPIRMDLQLNWAVANIINLMF